MDKAKAVRVAKQIQDSAMRLRKAAWAVERAFEEIEFFGEDTFGAQKRIPFKVDEVEADLAELTQQVKALKEATSPKQD